LERVDLDRLLARVDVDDIVSRVRVDSVVAETASSLAMSGLGVVRSQLARIDTFVTATARRVLRRSDLDTEAVVAALPAGPATRFVAYLVDTALVGVAFALLVALSTYLASIVSGHDVNAVDGGTWRVAGSIVFTALYLWLRIASSAEVCDLSCDQRRLPAATRRKIARPPHRHARSDRLWIMSRPRTVALVATQESGLLDAGAAGA